MRSWPEELGTHAECTEITEVGKASNVQSTESAFGDSRNSELILRSPSQLCVLCELCVRFRVFSRADGEPEQTNSESSRIRSPCLLALRTGRHQSVPDRDSYRTRILRKAPLRPMLGWVSVSEK